MIPENTKSKRLMGVFLLGWVLLSYPLLSLFNRPRLLFGIPLLFLYVYAVWACLIALIRLGTRGGASSAGRERGGGDA